MQLLPSPVMGYGLWALVAAAADLVSEPQVPYMYAASAGLVLLMSPWDAAERQTDEQTNRSLNSPRLSAQTASKPAVRPLPIQRVEVRTARQPVPAGYLLRAALGPLAPSAAPSRALNSRSEDSSPTSSFT
ncbi:uncharacterized protein TrAtP1_004041 [Trichoderma atroviride]|uniref:uncharacterized protein n=1 Tax=Hypocrea atroviridis TaxID=63577 RepID=UPI00331DE8E2|nr:hypothetical protein TrAtP1_004041 [Trichoderma atroviride]